MQEFRGKLQKVIKKANPDIDWGVLYNYNYYNNKKELPSTSGCSDEFASPRGMFDAMSIADSDYSSRGSSNKSTLLSPRNNHPPSSPSTASGLPKPNNGTNKVDQQQQWRAMIEALRFKNVRRFSNIPLLTASYEISRKNIRKKVSRKTNGEDDDDLPIDLDCIPTKPSWRNFPYADLVAATDNFSPENMLGKGGHAEVYRGRLPDGQIVAVKRLMNNGKEIEDQVGDFLSELGIIAHINHPNATHLLGFGIDNGLYFVLRYAPRGSIASLLFGSQCLEWNARFKLALGVAKGLKYLHHDCPRRIIHRDIKASNILLDDNYEAEISDFGLAKWLPDQWEHHVVFPIEGTFGYLAPEYFMHGLVDEKTDVFAFGVLLLELLTGRRAVDSNSRESLVIWAKPLLDSKQIEEIVDPKLGGQYDLTQMNNAMATASLCVHHKPSMRPYMNMVVKLLKGEDVSADEIIQRSSIISPKSLLLDACDLEDYTCSNYLNDINRHKQLLME